MSQPPEVAEINQLLAQAKNTFDATYGSAFGLTRDTVIGILGNWAQKMLSQQMQINRQTKEIEDLKKKVPESKKK